MGLKDSKLDHKEENGKVNMGAWVGYLFSLEYPMESLFWELVNRRNVKNSQSVIVTHKQTQQTLPKKKVVYPSWPLLT